VQEKKLQRINPRDRKMRFEMNFCEYCCAPLERKQERQKYCDPCSQLAANTDPLELAKRKLRAMEAELSWVQNEQTIQEQLRQE